VYTRVYMAKLYWRIKRNGKWTFVAMTDENTIFCCDESSEYKALVEDE